MITEHKISLSTTTIPTVPTIPTDATTIPTAATLIRAQVVTSTAAPTKGDNCGLEGSKFPAELRFRPNAILMVRPQVLEVER